MKRARLTAMIGVVALAGGIVAAYAGQFTGLPIVSGATYCSTATGATSSPACVSTTPAGPLSPSGSELVPADTNLSGGRSPQTVLLPIMQLGATLPAIASIAPSGTATSFTVTPLTMSVILSSQATVASAVTVTLPASPFNGQRLRLSSNNTMSSLTITANATPAGTTITQAPTVITVSTTAAYGYEFMYSTLGNNWFRLQ